MKRNRLGSSLLLVLVLAFGSPVLGVAQPSRSTPAAQVQREDTLQEASTFKEWFNYSGGLGTPFDVSGGVSYNFGWSTYFFQVGFNTNAEFRLFDSTPPQVSALDVAIGRRVRSTRTLGAVFVGPAFVWGRREPYGEERYSTGGVVINAHWYLRPFRGEPLPGIYAGALGVGVTSFVILNPVQPAAGIRLGFQVGSVE